MAEATHTTRGGVIRRNKGWLAMGASPWMIGLALIAVALATRVYQPLLGLIHLSILGAVGLGWAYKANRDPALEEGELTSGDHGVALDGRLLVRREELSQGFVVPHVKGTRLKLDRRGLRLPLLLQVQDPDEGRAILRSLGLDATQKAAELRAASWLFTQPLLVQLGLILGPLFGVFIPTLIGVTTTGRAAVPLVAFMALFILTYVLGLTMTPTKVRVGADGVLTQWLFKRRFIPIEEIESCEPYDETVGNKKYLGVWLALRDGSRVKIISGQAGWNDEDRDLLSRRIREALSEHEGGAHVETSTLARRGRSPLDWVRELKRIGAGANADLRTAPVPVEALLRVVGDTSEAPTRRAGAAVAALPHVDEEGRRALRFAVDTTVEPKLRIALGKVIRDDATEEQLAEALAELEASAEDAAEADVPGQG